MQRLVYVFCIEGVAIYKAMTATGGIDLTTLEVKQDANRR
jgi:hypothetical protein